MFERAEEVKEREHRDKFGPVDHKSIFEGFTGMKHLAGQEPAARPVQGKAHAGPQGANGTAAPSGRAAVPNL